MTRMCVCFHVFLFEANGARLMRFIEHFRYGELNTSLMNCYRYLWSKEDNKGLNANSRNYHRYLRSKGEPFVQSGIPKSVSKCFPLR